MPQLHPQIGEIYRHFKGNLYQVTALAVHSETGGRMVVYQALYGDYQTYVRDYEQFVSEVDFAKYPTCTSRFRFTFIPREELAFAAGKGPVPVPAQRPASASGSEPSPEPTGSTGMKGSPVPEHPTEPEPAPAGRTTPREKEIHELMIEFLDERNFEEKDKILSEIGAHKDLSDGMIDNLAAALDYVIDEGPLDLRFAQLRTCVRTRARFENTRLRG